jgi:hypothetical protein
MTTHPRLLFVALLSVCGVLGLSPHARAIPPFWQEFQAQYVKPDSDDEKVKAFAELAASKETGQCLVCHVKGEEKSVRNRFGAALAELLDKDNFKKQRLDGEPDEVKKEIVAAFEKVTAQKSDADDENSPTFGELLAQGKFPGVVETVEAEKPEEKEPQEEENATEDVPAADDAAPAAAGAGSTSGLATQLFSQLKDEIRGELIEQLKPQLEEELRDELRAVLKAELKASLKDTLKAVVMAELNAVEEIDPQQEADAINKILEMGGSVMQIAQNDDSNIVDFHLGGKELTDEGLENVKSVGKLVHLDLKDTQVTDEGLRQIANITTLTRLNLARTQVSDEGLEYLKGLDNIEYLNLYGSQVTDAGLEHLVGMTNLRKLYLWQSKVTPGGASKLQKELPDCEVNY